MLTSMGKQTLKLILVATSFLTIIAGALFLAQFVSTNDSAQAYIASAGYAGVVGVAILAGLNAILPFPAASFAPAFVEAGMTLPFIVFALVVGTIIADAIGYFFGSWSKETISLKYPISYARISRIISDHHSWVLPLVILYAALVPFPNEFILIPLALSGFSFRTLIPALIVGNSINQTVLVYGFTSLFSWLF